MHGRVHPKTSTNDTSVQKNLNLIYNTGFTYRFRIQTTEFKRSENFKTEFSLKYDNYDTTIQGELHILPTDVLPTYPSFKAKTGPT